MRLGLTQEDLAAKFELDKSTVYIYERGDRPPTAAHLATLHELGGDAQFVVSGRRLGSYITDEWPHVAIQAIREITESGAWEKLDWDEREKVTAMFLKGGSR